MWEKMARRYKRELSKFTLRVLELVKKIPKGRVSTYKELGKALGRRGQVYRAVGRALKENPCPVKIPCHRVVCSDGSIGGYSGKGGIRKKIKLLEKEGIKIKNGKIVDFSKKIFRFDMIS